MKNSDFILIDKPKRITSHDVVNHLRKITGQRKIGHAGTLDPIATGLLILGIGRKATKKLSQFQKLDKEYIVKIKLGAISDTFDSEGKIEKKKVEKIPNLNEVEEVLKIFVGEIEQIPPSFSAKKIKGKKAYQLARKGLKIKLKPIKVKIYKIEILNYSFPYLEIKVLCSSGTYIRSLANDIGEKLSCGGYVEELRRIKIGNFSVEKAVKLDDLNSENWRNFLF
ncbi:MAG: tRNA pseudouridine(55) synthase TruB [Patescibacteria group bacterium]